MGSPQDHYPSPLTSLQSVLHGPASVILQNPSVTSLLCPQLLSILRGKAETLTGSVIQSHTALSLRSRHSGLYNGLQQAERCSQDLHLHELPRYPGDSSEGCCNVTLTDTPWMTVQHNQAIPTSSTCLTFFHGTYHWLTHFYIYLFINGFPQLKYKFHVGKAEPNTCRYQNMCGMNK